MNNGSASDDLRGRMAAAREALERDAHAAFSDARKLTDWQYHFRAHPWVFLAGAAAVGFLLVPRPDKRSLAPPLGPRRTEEQGDASEPTKKSLAATALAIGGTFLARQALNYVTRRGMNWLELRAAANSNPHGAASEEGVRP